ncbi:MAG: hypothetical protein KJ886_03025 [Candidatus Thermoplasmatota archaeon]|nr:hypothetical protein [Candidatus Thermoplasmatota archaeon]MCG2825705.1 hypothetical protein [Thermoplasmatales archaeon]
MRKIIGLVIGVCLCFLFFSGNAAAGYDDTINDGTGDVWYWYATENTWGYSYNKERPNIDITQISMSESGGTVTVTMKVKGTITDSENIMYQLSIVDDQNTSYSIWYSNETCWLYGVGETMYTGADLSENTSHSGGTLTIHFQLTDIGNPGQLKFATYMAGCTHDYAETGDTTGEYYYDMVPDVSTGEGIDYDYDSKKFIPGFEVAFLIGAIGISAVLLSKKLR